jgi:hypothetical protein
MAKAVYSEVLVLAAALCQAEGITGGGFSSTELFYPSVELVRRTSNCSLSAELLVRPVLTNRNGLLYAETIGLATFALPEICHMVGKSHIAEIYNNLMNLSQYLIDNGSVIDNGDTVSDGLGGVLMVRKSGGGLDRELIELVSPERHIGGLSC